MTNLLHVLWAKTAGDDTLLYHPLLLHMLDVAVSAEAILNREPPSTRNQMAAIFGGDWGEARGWFLLLMACHDLGKASPGFQLKWLHAKKILENAGLKLPKLPDTNVNHAFISQVALEKLLIEVGWQEEMAFRCADAVGCHHGTRASPSAIDNTEFNTNGADTKNWLKIWRGIFELLSQVFSVGKIPGKKELSGSDFMLLSGIASYADWIGSNEEWFPFGTVNDCKDLNAWFLKRCANGERALDAIGWTKRSPLISTYRTFVEAFPDCKPPRPLQEAFATAVANVDSPCVFLVEAPMGEGKTEAAFYAHLELQRRFGHRGMYVALPSKATGNAMFTRTRLFLQMHAVNRHVDLQLLHGAAQLNDEYQQMRLGQVYDDEHASSVRVGDWFTNKKRTLLSEYGVGTIDQALLTILPVRHYFVRLWGLANRVVIFDEIHAYDAYTCTLLFHLIRWLRALGSSVILLSATLPPEFRRRLAATLNTNLPEKEVGYPRFTLLNEGVAQQIHFNADPNRKLEINVKSLPAFLSSFIKNFEEQMPLSGYGGVIVNTVQRAQDLYILFGEGNKIHVDEITIGKRLTDGTEVYLFHARYPAENRQKREDAVLAIFGKTLDDNKNFIVRKGRRILIATQVAEQSLDLDFDLLITDLAPIDLVLQRAGRLWRHKKGVRPIMAPVLCVAGLEGEKPESFGEPLWWDCVYREDILLKTWNILKDANYHTLVLPDCIDKLVASVYEGLVLPTDKDILMQLDKAEIYNEGVRVAKQTLAHQAIIGLPGDGSWKDCNGLGLYDDDEPGVHVTLKAQTRLGEDSLTAIIFEKKDDYNPKAMKSFDSIKKMAFKAVNISRKSIVCKLRSLGVPDEWKKVSLLRNSYPMFFDENGNWTEDRNVRFDDELGIVYVPKEV